MLAVFLPVWAAFPTLGQGERDSLPTLRSTVADRLLGWGTPTAWPVCFLHFVAESARTGLRELDRLHAAADRARALTDQLDCRARLADAFDTALRTPALTPKTLAIQLRIAPQTATSLLRTLQTAGIVREVTGRRSFRAFAV